MRRMVTVCHLWPSIAPHGPEYVQNSIWNLPYGVWLGIAQACDDYLASLREEPASG